MSSLLKSILESDEVKQQQALVDEYKSRDYNDDELYILWTYIQSYELGDEVDGTFNCFDLTREEYGYCIKRIFGENSYNFFMESTKHDIGWLNNKGKITKRNANSIIKTYERRGHPYLFESLDKRVTKNDYKYLTPSGKLNNHYTDMALKLLERKYYE